MLLHCLPAPLFCIVSTEITSHLIVYTVLSYWLQGSVLLHNGIQVHRSKQTGSFTWTVSRTLQDFIVKVNLQTSCALSANLSLLQFSEANLSLLQFSVQPIEKWGSLVFIRAVYTYAPTSLYSYSQENSNFLYTNA
jgi:hypothetical protein